MSSAILPVTRPQFRRSMSSESCALYNRLRYRRILLLIMAVDTRLAPASALRSWSHLTVAFQSESLLLRLASKEW
jgi:hypothetical protein